MNINIYKKAVYGITKWYVRDESQAKAISTLTGNKTISDYEMKALEVLGFTFTEVIAP